MCIHSYIDSNREFVCNVELTANENGRLRIIDPNVDCSKCYFYEDIEDRTFINNMTDAHVD